MSKSEKEVLGLVRSKNVNACRYYRLWSAIKNRCFNPSNKDFGSYGARGITVFTPWRDDPDAFKSWVLTNLGPCPTGHQFDRINNDGNYEPGNVRWATVDEQQQNRRSTRLSIRKVGFLRRMHQCGDFFQSNIAWVLGVDTVTVFNVIHGNTWKEVPLVWLEK